jgi:hypothetical protein
MILFLSRDQLLSDPCILTIFESFLMFPISDTFISLDAQVKVLEGAFWLILRDGLSLTKKSILEILFLKLLILSLADII